MLSVDTAPEKFENTTATSHFGIELGLALEVKLRFQIS